MMCKQLIIILTFAISLVFSRTVTFKVISFGSKTELKIHYGKKYTLSPVDDDDLLHGITIEDLPDKPIKYYYIIDDVKESFYRTLEEDENTTHNELFEREHTIQDLKKFHHPENFKIWNKSIGKTSLFDDSYIPTIHIIGENAEKHFKDPHTYKKIELEKVKFYLKDTVEIFSNVESNAKNRGFPKFQLRLKLGENERPDYKGKGKGINGRHVLKLRNGSEDPLNLRQFIYGNIIQTLGMPSLHSVMVRVYYNKKPVGFYTLQEDVTTNSFIKAEFYGDPEEETNHAPEDLGYILDGTTGSDFEYQPDNLKYYSPFSVKKGETRDRLVALCKAISELDTSDEKEVEKFEEKWFDIDTFHKAMAMEYLTGDWDGYWYTTSNFAVYDDPVQSSEDNYKFYFITQDHDETFGVGLTERINKIGWTFPEHSYTTMINRTWHISLEDAEHRTLVDKFISSTPALQKRFQDTLLTIVKEIFNPVAFREVVKSYYHRFKYEVKWDNSFERPYTPRKNEGPRYNYKDFTMNFETGVGGLKWGLFEWVELRSEAIKKEFCITWEGDENPPSDSCVPINDL